MKTAKSNNLRKEPHLRNGVIYEKIYECTLYPDSMDIYSILALVKALDIEYAYILHDKCLDENGEPKKPHYHLLLRFNRERSIKSLSKYLKIPVNLIEWKANFCLSLQYLIHFNNSDKHKYPLKELHCNFDNRIYFSDSESDIVLNIVDYAIQNHLNKYQLMCYCNSSNYWGFYRKNYHIIWDIITDYNYSHSDTFTCKPLDIEY